MKKLIRFKVKTEDTILFISRIIVIDAASKEELTHLLKKNFPNSRVIDIEEIDL